MKFQTITLTLLLAACSFSAQAQLKPSSEPRPQMDTRTGETIILPVFVETKALAVPATEKKQSPLVVRNLAQKRVQKIEKQKNGFYAMNSSMDWGTNLRLNSYGQSSRSEL